MCVIVTWNKQTNKQTDVAENIQRSSLYATTLSRNFEIISVFYFTRNHVWNWNKIISAAERVPKLFQNYFSEIDRAENCSRTATSLRNNFEMISAQVSTRLNKISSDGRRQRLK